MARLSLEEVFLCIRVGEKTALPEEILSLLVRQLNVGEVTKAAELPKGTHECPIRDLSISRPAASNKAGKQHANDVISTSRCLQMTMTNLTR
jgi:hypothetical protein